MDALELFKSKKISPSITRLKIFNLLDAHDFHPTADDLFKSLKNELPTLSKTTIYNVLNLFIEKGIVDVVKTSNNEQRFEQKHDNHSHFHCTICGKLFDIPKVKTTISESLPDGFKVIDDHVTITGICKTCLRKK